MTSTLAPGPATRRPPTTAARFGFAVSIVVNLVLLWAAYQLLDWGWPGFLTADFERLLPLVTASLVVSIAANVAYLLWDRRWVRPLGDLVIAAVGVVVTVRFLDVFPFDFAGYATDWSWLARTVLAVGLVGAAISVIVNGVKLLTDG
ncbi:MAG TPA: hypothetical protein VK906_11690 [Egicoccus sp.]|nr:hypothetical protein [Egicoccus sp.]HSK23835.1 hypothetical protein [Egicoccus sp.]